MSVNVLRIFSHPSSFCYWYYCIDGWTSQCGHVAKPKMFWAEIYNLLDGDGGKKNKFLGQLLTLLCISLNDIPSAAKRCLLDFWGG